MPMTKPRISKPGMAKPKATKPKVARPSFKTSPGRIRLTSGLAKVKRGKKW